MTIRRVNPDLHCDDLDAARAFYERLGFRETMDLGWVLGLGSPEDRRVGLLLMTEDATAPEMPALSVEVDDVDAVYETVRASGAEIVHPLTDEEWGVRRFFVRDPGGNVVNVLSHR